MSTPSPKEARKFIADVRENNGGLTVEDRDFLAANRPSALRILKNTRRQLADSIKILVDNLYSKETRFLYELIQNAEDNSYSTATADGERPFLAFKLYPDRIIIDSNEDGFSKSNIRAICSVGNSTKKQSAGYIGEKGIGFKSVFKIAQKVYIQSGPFSFAFSYTREDDDDGLGMITPYYQEAEELPMGVRTRMELTLSDSAEFEELASEFRAVPDTFLMFLSRLQRLSIELYPPDNTHTATQYSKKETKENGLYTTFLTKTSRNGMQESTSEQKYYTMKSDLHDLPFDEARKDKEGKSIDRATVILAFPVDEHDEPVLKQQYTYAFLPLRRVGFKFLIQADFVTQANREDVVHSKRNQAVLNGVAKAFADAMVVFCKRPSLRYRWMRYLPEDFISDEFWKTLWTLVHEKLVQTPLLEPWSGIGLYKPADLQKPPERCLAEDRTPLLPDLEGAEIYLSPKYIEADFQILKRLGTISLQWTKFIDRLDADLRILRSKWRTLTNNADWRTRICKVLSTAIAKPDQQKRLRTFALIPLHDGKWISSASGTKIYFPKTDDVPIPVDLGLDLVCQRAAENVAWADFHLALGVMGCPQESVINSIYRRYKAASLDNFTLFNAVAHIRYLYWFLPKDHSSLTSQIRLANQHGSLLKKDQYLYFPEGEDDCSPSKLFKQDDQLPGLPVHYLHEDYLKAVDPEVIRHGRPWMSWLEEIVGVRRIPELRAKDHDGLSKEFQYIVEYRSNRLLRTLKRGWDFYSPQIKDAAEEDLLKSTVLLENGYRMALECTFLPLPKLKQITTELGIADAFPFIAISKLLREEQRLGWMFVQDLKVGIEENLDFYISALDTLKRSNPTLSSTSARDQLIRIYKNIQSRCSENLDYVRSHFENALIWIESSNSIGSSWLSTADCVWDGPQWLKSKQCLKHEAYIELEPLFKVSLKIPDASYTDVVNDLLMLKSHDRDKNAMRTQFAGLKIDKCVEEAEKRYDYLWQKHLSPEGENPENWKALQLTFESSALMYIPKENGWRTPSQCVWVKSNVEIPGKASIADAYPLLGNFFTTVLNISKPTVEMYVDSMKAEAKGNVSAARIKETMRLICTLGVGEEDFSSLVEVKILPVKFANGVGGFASASSKDKCVDFAIVENTIHWDAFKGKIVVLDFSLEEIRDTRPLLLAMGLVERFSSNLVNEVTDVRGGSQDHEMTRNLRSKSQAIVRCAFHFASLNKRQDIASLYRKLKRATVYVSDGIRRSLQITQNGRSIESASSRADFHFEEAESALQLYLPKDEAERDVCFESDLPRRLCTYLAINDPGASAVIGGVFRKDNPVVIDRILEKAGVSQYDGDFAALDEEFEPSKIDSDIDTLVEATGSIRPSTPISGPRSYTPSGWARWREDRPGSESAKPVRDEVMPSSSRQEQREPQDIAYKRLLEHVVNVARRRVLAGVVEPIGLWDENLVATEALPQDIIQTAFATRTQERYFKVGAAGELYVFEYLKGLDLPRFGLENWKSEIRDRVKIHTDYHNVEKYGDRSAIADLEYLDDSGTLTRFLIHKGYLGWSLWDCKRPLYHIEIKTTTSSNWQEPFFMSKAQERHIHDKRIEHDKTNSSIYMIWRIFNLGQGDKTGMHIYLDPETLRENHELEFSAHTWAVKPLKKPGWPTETVGATAEKSGNTGTNDAKKGLGSVNFGGFDSSATSSDPGSSNRAFQSSTLESQINTESLRGNLSGSNSAHSINNASTQPPPKSNIFGTAKSPSMLGAFSAFHGLSPNKDTPKSSSLSLFGSNATSFNSGISKATKGGLFGANATFANDPASKASSTGLNFGTFPSVTGSSGFDSSLKSSSTCLEFGTIANSDASKDKSSSASAFSLFGSPPKVSHTSFDFGTIVNNDASKVPSPNATGVGWFDFSTGTTSEAPSRKGRFESPKGNHSSRSSETYSSSGAFGTKPVSSNLEHLKSIWSTQSSGTADSLPSATTGASDAKPSSGGAKTPETTSTLQLQPSFSTTTDSVFGRAAPSIQSGPSQGATGYSEFGTTFPTPRVTFGTNATACTSNEADSSTTSIFDLSRAREARKEASQKSTIDTHEVPPPEPTGSQGSLFNLPPQTKNPFHKFLEGEQKPLFAPGAPDLSPLATEEKAQAAETQPAATRDGTSDETQTGDE